MSVMVGYTRCGLHGAKGPSAIIKAERSMALARDPAIEALHLIIAQFLGDTCPTCGFPKGDAEEKRVVARTAQTILDRAGMGPRATLELTQTQTGMINLELLMPEEKVELLGLITQVRRFKDTVRERQRLNASVIDVTPEPQKDPEYRPAPDPLPLVVKPGAPPRIPERPAPPPTKEALQWWKSDEQ